MKDLVSLTQCANYERKNVLRAMEESIRNLGGLDGIIKKDARIFLKVNLIMGASPREAVTTHPEVIYALAKILKDHGSSIVIGDSPGAGVPFTKKALQQVYSKCGYMDIANELDVELNYDTRAIAVSCHDGQMIKQFNAMKPVIDAEAVISLAKGKTHGFTYITGAVKNMFGIVPGFEKSAYHFKLQTLDRFSRMLVDICEFVKPALSITDAIVCMEGDGPCAGKTKNVGVLIASRNPHAVDAVFCEVIGVDCRTLPTISNAISRKLLNPGDIEVIGATADVQIADFKMPATVGVGDGLSGPGLRDRIIRPLFKEAFVVKPAIIKDKCSGCGICVKSCPVKAIVLKKNVAAINYDKCIRCYCCHEMCPQRSIELRKSMLYILARKFV